MHKEVGKCCEKKLKKILVCRQTVLWHMSFVLANTLMKINVKSKHKTNLALV